jgi:hypothetical protein
MLCRLLNSVKGSQATWLALCNTLNPNRTATFLNDSSNHTIEIVCSLAGLPAPSNPSTGDSNIPQSSVDNIHQSASSLLAWQILGFFTSSSQVTNFCESYGSYNSSVAGLGLDPGIVQTTICPYTRRPLPVVAVIRRHWAASLTTIYTSQLWALSDSIEFQQLICTGYKTWTLANFKESKLDGTVLIWEQVVSEISAYCRSAIVVA